jgi:preprotein translocase subunit SecG
MASLVIIGLVIIVFAIISISLSNLSQNTMESTAKHFALQLGSLVSLYVSLGALINLLFGVITVQFPDVINGYYEYDSATYAIRLTIALLVVFFPTYIVLTRLVNVGRRTQESAYLGLTKWLIYLSLLVGGAVMLGDVVMVINNFLNGEITIRFVLKALVVLIAVGSAFVYYLFDARGYWQTHEKQSKQYGLGAIIVIAASLVLGFMYTETPSQVREMRLDQTQITDLQDMQNRVEESYRVTGKLPQTLSELYVGTEVPTAPEERASYTYKVDTATSFELCGEFAYPSSRTDQSVYSQPVYDGMLIKNPYNWDHKAGAWCFTRIINAPLMNAPLVK